MMNINEQFEKMYRELGCGNISNEEAEASFDKMCMELGIM